MKHLLQAFNSQSVGQSSKMSDSKTTRKRGKRWRVASLVIAFLIVGLFPLPFSIRVADREAAVSHAINAVVHNRTVLHSTSIRRLYDCSFVDQNEQLYFRNGLDVPDDVFLRYGLKAIPNDRDIDVDAGDVIISFGASPDDQTQIYFSYVFGSRGAQGYSISMRKSLFKRWFVYSHQWVS